MQGGAGGPGVGAGARLPGLQLLPVDRGPVSAQLPRRRLAAPHLLHLRTQAILIISIIIIFETIIINHLHQQCFNYFTTHHPEFRPDSILVWPILKREIILQIVIESCEISIDMNIYRNIEISIESFIV